MGDTVATHSPSHDLAGPAGKGATGLSRRRAWRQLWIEVHSYLGLFVGALLVVFGVTGSVLVCWQEIDEWLNPALLTVTVPSGVPAGEQEYRSLGEILAAALQVSPGSRVTQIYGPGSSEGVFAVYADQPSKAWARCCYRGSI